MAICHVPNKCNYLVIVPRASSMDHKFFVHTSRTKPSGAKSARSKNLPGNDLQKVICKNTLKKPSSPLNIRLPSRIERELQRGHFQKNPSRNLKANLANPSGNLPETLWEDAFMMPYRALNTIMILRKTNSDVGSR